MEDLPQPPSPQMVMLIREGSSMVWVVWWERGEGDGGGRWRRRVVATFMKLAIRDSCRVFPCFSSRMSPFAVIVLLSNSLSPRNRNSIFDVLSTSHRTESQYRQREGFCLRVRGICDPKAVEIPRAVYAALSTVAPPNRSTPSVGNPPL